MGFHNIRIANRHRERADILADTFSTPTCRLVAMDWEKVSDAMSDIDLLVQATSLGMVGQSPLSCSLASLPLSATVTDVVYTPLETALLRQARERGHPVIDGLGMLLHQGRPAFAAFFGPDPAVTDELRAFILAGT
jgi:shikimate dehydrogenase